MPYILLVIWLIPRLQVSNIYFLLGPKWIFYYAKADKTNEIAYRKRVILNELLLSIRSFTTSIDACFLGILWWNFKILRIQGMYTLHCTLNINFDFCIIFQQQEKSVRFIKHFMRVDTSPILNIYANKKNLKLPYYIMYISRLIDFMSSSDITQN